MIMVWGSMWPGCRARLPASSRELDCGPSGSRLSRWAGSWKLSAVREAPGGSSPYPWSWRTRETGRQIMADLTGTTVVLADDHAIVREGFAALCEVNGMRVLGQCSDGPSAVEMILAQQPDFVI